jgi:hypothetical protein
MKPKLVLALLFLLAACAFLWSQANASLTRAQAGDAIRNSQAFKQPFTVSVGTRFQTTIVLSNARAYNSLKTAGWITIVNDRFPQSYIVALTDVGRRNARNGEECKSLLPGTPAECSASFPAAHRVLLGVTGLMQSPQGVIAEFYWAWIPITNGFGEVYDRSGPSLMASVSQGAALLQKWDDGWRIATFEGGQQLPASALPPGLPTPVTLFNQATNAQAGRGATPPPPPPAPPSAVVREADTIGFLQQISTTEVTCFSMNNSRYCDMPSLIRLGLLDSRFAGPVGGYTFTIIVDDGGRTYRAAARPATPQGGTQFFVAQDGIVRYANGNPAPPPPSATPPRR